MTLIEQLYYGELIPAAHPPLNPDKWRDLIRQVTAAEDALLDGMTDEQRQKYQAYYDSASRHHAEETLDSFTLGFRIGARLMLEVLSESSTTQS